MSIHGGNYLNEGNMKKYFILTLLLSLTCSVCNAQRQNSGIKEFEVECLGVEGDGSQTVRAYGFGKDKEDATDQAQKNAVYAVIFKGITKGSGCNMKPLINEVNAREKYEDYFDNFFKDDGPFKDFISMDDERMFGREDTRNALGRRYAVVITVLRSELRMKLKEDGILK